MNPFPMESPAHFENRPADCETTPDQPLGAENAAFGCKPNSKPPGFGKPGEIASAMAFPIEAFPPRLRDVAEEMARVYQTPVCLPAMSALGVLSGAVGKSVVVCRAYKDKTTYLNLFIVAVAERGSGKGNIGETLCAPLNERSALLLEQHRKRVAENRTELGVLRKEIARKEQESLNATGHERANLLETLSNRQQRLAELEKEAERQTALIISDTTSEALGRLLADCQRSPQTSHSGSK